MHLPEQLLQSLEGAKGFERKSFEEVHASGEQVTSIRFNPARNFQPQLDNIQLSPVPWARDGYYLQRRPSFTFDPLFHAGTYYVQEASSMFLEQALKQSTDLSQSIRVLDLCASPGGKSTHIQSMLSPGSLLVSNDVIRSRANILKDNIIKWGSLNVMVTNNDPADFGALENYFDVIVVDAPCSGSGLFRRDADAIGEWSPNNVALCTQRQQRILADVWPSLKKDGILIYSTCSYSMEEDEDIVRWLQKEFPLEILELTIEDNWNIIPSAGGYRFWPGKVKGEGFFLACLRKKEGDAAAIARTRKRPEPATKKEIEIIAKWVDQEGLSFIKHLQTVYAWPAALENEFSFLLNRLRVIYSGTIIGELMRDKLVPDHALALSPLVNAAIRRTALGYDEAIQYLQRKDISLEHAGKGWQLVIYEGNPLGWVNVLSNRINNYYPKELRILKDK